MGVMLQHTFRQKVPRYEKQSGLKVLLSKGLFYRGGKEPLAAL